MGTPRSDAIEPRGDDIGTGDLLRDTQVESVPGMPGRYSADLPDAWRIFYAFGGATFAVALRAAIAAVDRADLRLVTAEATYCAAIPCGPLAAQVEVLRDGRRGAQAQVRLWATDDPAGPAGSDLVVTVVFGASDPASPHGFTGVPFPEDVRPPRHSGERPVVDPQSPFANIPYHRQTDYRPAIGHAPGDPAFTEPGEARTAAWFRFRRPPLAADGSWETWSLAVPGDVLGPAVSEGLGPQDPFLIITLQLSMQFLEPMRGEFLCQHTRAHHVGDGFATGTAELWSEDHRLIALCTQSAMLQPFKAG